MFRDRRARPIALRAASAAAALALAACSTLPPNTGRTASSAFTDTAGTALGRAAAASVRPAAAGPLQTVASTPAPSAGATSGFRLIAEGETAFATLVTLVEAAERSLDLQYYVLEDDDYTRALFRAVRRAADRGVRVRILVDDLYTTGKDDRIAWYSAHPNVDVRLFNPFGAGRSWLATRIAASAFEIGRINHRMHNKLAVADNAIAVTGGRNVGAEYYQHSERTNFLDLDVLCAGPIVRDLSASFDRYWNSDAAYPIETLVKQGDRGPDPRQSRVDDGAVARAAAEADERGAPLRGEIASGRIAVTPAAAELLVDAPTKVDETAPKVEGGRIAQGRTVASDVIAIARSAQRELIVISPYFVPGERGLAVFKDLVDRGVTVRVLTNSLAATDATVVHIGYARYREALLRMGVELYEFRPQPPGSGPSRAGIGSSKASLHAKVLLVDREQVFIGSFNVDPRSALSNTELGIHMESPALAGSIVDEMRARGEEGRYKVTLDERGRLHWTTRTDGAERVFDDEPEAGTALKLTLKILAPFAPEQML